jgi:hypothetical protein
VIKCNHQCQSFGPCELEAGHKGRHSTEVFVCEACGKARRGKPAAEAVDGHPDEGAYMKFCFMCEPPWYANLSPDLARR